MMTLLSNNTSPFFNKMLIKIGGNKIVEANLKTSNAIF